MANSNGSKLRTYGLWALKIVVALIFLAAAGSKLSGQEMMVAEFDKVGLGQGFRYVVGLIEFAGAVLLLVPKTMRYGATLLLCVSLGACIAQAIRIHMDVIHTFVFMAVTGWLTWTGWKRSA